MSPALNLLGGNIAQPEAPPMLYLAQLEETDNDEGESYVKVLGIFPEEASARRRIDEELNAISAEEVSAFGCVTAWPLGQGWPVAAWNRANARGADGEWHEIPVEESIIAWPVAPR